MAPPVSSSRWLLLALLATSITKARAQDQSLGRSVFSVLTCDNVPFAYAADPAGSMPTGFDMDFLAELAVRGNFTYTVEQTLVWSDYIGTWDSPTTYDFGICGTSITAKRSNIMTFSYPYYDAGLGILIRSDDDLKALVLADQLWNSPQLSIIGLIALIFYQAVAHIVWLIERNYNDGIDKTYWKGIGDAFWFTAVTATTVGYGDKVPITYKGKVLSILWMFLGVLFFTFVTASITTALTVEVVDSSDIQTELDLVGRKVCTVSGSTGATYMSTSGYGSKTSYRETLQDCFTMVEASEVEAVVYDYPMLQNYASTSETTNTVGGSFQPEVFGIVMTLDSPLAFSLNPLILQVLEDREFMRSLESKYGLSGQSDSGLSPTQVGIYTVTVTGISLTGIGMAISLLKQWSTRKLRKTNIKAASRQGRVQSFHGDTYDSAQVEDLDMSMFTVSAGKYDQ